MRRGVTLAAKSWRPTLTNLGRTKPRGSWNDLWGKCADGWGDRGVKCAAEGVHGTQDGENRLMIPETLNDLAWELSCFAPEMAGRSLS